MKLKIAIKILSYFAKDPEKSKKVVFGVVFGCIALMIGLPAIMLGCVSSFSKNGTVTTDYDPTTTSTYKSVNPIYEGYMTEVQTEEDEIAAKLIEDNTIVVTTTQEYIDSEGKTKTRTVTETKVPTVITELNYINHGYAFAYINMTDEKVLKGKKYKSTPARDKKIKEFYKSINSIKTKQTGEMSYVVYNEFLSIDAVADMYFGNSEADREMFITSYKLYCEFFGVDIEGTGTSGGTTGGSGGSRTGESGEDVSGGMNIPLYLQYSGSWSSVPFGDGTIKSSGCSVTCLAMVMSYLTGNTVLPSDIVAFTGNKYHVAGQGASWGIFPAVAIHYQVSCSNLGMDSNAIIDALKNGRPVIASVGPGTFTQNGHFIVLRGITEDGKILVNDPNDNSTKNHKGTAFELSLIMNEAKNFWSFY